MKGHRILLCPDCRARTGKRRELGIVLIERNWLRCAGSVATREGVWTC